MENELVNQREYKLKHKFLSRCTLALNFGLALFFLGCAATQAPKLAAPDPTSAEVDVLQIKDNADEALKISQENKLEIQTLNTKMKEIEGRFAALQEQLATLSPAKFEELQQQVRLLQEQFKNMESALSHLKSVPEKGVATFTPSSNPPNNAVVSDDKKNPKPEAKVLTKNAPPKKIANEAEAQLYKKAFDLYYARDYEKAILKFEEIIHNYPSGAYVDNSYYWIGECHFSVGNFAKAITSFRKVLTFADTEKADDAQIKLGYCFLRLGDRKQAVEEFKKLVSLYPDSEYLERAKDELAKLE